MRSPPTGGNSRVARHHFCRTCGIYPFHRKRSEPDHYGVNVFCLDGFDVGALPIRLADGRSMSLVESPPMKLRMYQVDAFADGPFEGNPAAVVPLDRWLPDSLMQTIAMENNLAETAFFVPEGEDFGLRWFTPGRGGAALRPRDPGEFARAVPATWAGTATGSSSTPRAVR
jgi:hypothetical protein